MGSLKQIGSMLAASTFDREEVLKHTMDMIRTIMNVEAGSLLLLERKSWPSKPRSTSTPRSMSMPSNLSA